MKFAVIGIGILVVLFGVLNHSSHFLNGSRMSTIIVAVGAIIAVVGVAMMFMGRKSSAA